MVKALHENPEASMVSSYRHIIDEKGKRKPPLPVSRRTLYQDGLIEGLRAINVFHGLGSNMIGEPTTTMFRRQSALSYTFYLDNIGGVEPEAGLDDINLWFFYCDYFSIKDIRTTK